MKLKAVPYLMAGFMLALSPSLGFAQHAGFQIAVAPPAQFNAAPVQTPAVAVRSTFGATPGIIVIQPQPIPSISLVPSFRTIIVPNQVLVPGQTFVNTTAVNPVHPNFAPPVRRFPSPGTPRVDVLRQYGQPSVTIITSSGETLYFTGGVTVIIQNGVVTGPR